MERRALLSLGVATLCGGCIGLGERRRPRLAWVWLQNDRDEAYEVDVAVAEGDESVFSGTYRLGATPGTANVTVDDLVEGPGRYVIRATMDGETREVDTVEHVDGDEVCIGVRFSLLDNGSVDYWTKSMRRC